VSTAPLVAPAHPVKSLLDSGVPLSLLFDLVWGPRSEELLERERPVVPGARNAVC
jgi:hypothetical protein